MPIALPTRTVRRPDLFLIFVVLVALASVGLEIVDPAPMDATAASIPSP